MTSRLQGAKISTQTALEKLREIKAGEAVMMSTGPSMDSPKFPFLKSSGYRPSGTKTDIS